MKTIDELFDAAMTLSPERRVALAERLLASVADKKQSEIDAAWAEEAQQRLRDYDEGKIKAIPAEEVFRTTAAVRFSRSKIDP